ncbi:hypothetical protein [Pseudonocardia sp. T1-2H]|uniref:hypothetical protein n=1 Tax=Pseudonocardia sp. T1-2H TaxID=3128899 RepID=UPI003101A4AB
MTRIRDTAPVTDRDLDRVDIARTVKRSGHRAQAPQEPTGWTTDARTGLSVPANAVRPFA